MAGPRPAPAGLPPARFLLAGVGYLVAVALLVIGGTVVRLLTGGAAGSLGSAMETRDLLALFGWVGLTISGVSLIVLPNHWGVRFQPAWVPRLHWWVTNAGLAGFTVSSLLGASGGPYWAIPAGLLAAVAGSYLVFASGVVWTFRRSTAPPWGHGRPVDRAPARNLPEPAGSVRP